MVPSEFASGKFKSENATQIRSYHYTIARDASFEAYKLYKLVRRFLKSQYLAFLREIILTPIDHKAVRSHASKSKARAVVPVSYRSR
jgi:hypothetical protein